MAYTHVRVSLEAQLPDPADVPAVVAGFIDTIDFQLRSRPAWDQPYLNQQSSAYQQAFELVMFHAMFEEQIEMAKNMTGASHEAIVAYLKPALTAAMLKRVAE